MKKQFQILCGFCLAIAFQATVSAQIITDQPQNVTVNNASTASFAVGASGTLSYQWQLNGTNLSDETNPSDGVMISGSTNLVLTLEDVTTNEAGTYTVVVNGSQTSSNAVLTIVSGTIVTFTFSGFPGGGTSNVDVQLFDHDKPATVENFIHYIRAGAFTNNMFFHRCIPWFILQGGGYGATDRTNTVPPITGWDIASQYTTATNQNPPFPQQVDSEFNVGPLIHNRFGTIAMALLPNDPDSATSGFFLNLADNSANLDSQNGGFTVFGRILDGTNVLQYFNTLNTGIGIVGATTFLDNGVTNNNPPFSTLPVNYIGTNAPTNANLFFCDIPLPTNAPVDTTPPTVAITSPAISAVLTNGNPTIQGTASDDVGLAVVICTLIPQPAADETYPNGGVSITNYAVGTTNWSVNFTNSNDASGFVPPGNYILSVQSQDGAGNLSPAISQSLIITAILIDGSGTVSLTNGINAVGYPFQTGSSYTVLATPDINQLFDNWSAGGVTVITNEVPFYMRDGFVLTATFISNGIPNGIAFTYPEPNAIISTNAFILSGTISNVSSLPVTVTCQIYSESTLRAVGLPLSNSGTTSWSVNVSGLPIGSYTVQAIAVDSSGNSTIITENFFVATNTSLQLNIVGPGTVSGATNGQSFPLTNGQYFPVGTTFQVDATPDSGQFFYTWSSSAGISLSQVQTYTMTPDLTLTATFVSNTLPSNCIAFTSPASNVVLSNYTVQVAGTISNAPQPPVSVTCQIFSQKTQLAVTPPQTTSGMTNWSLIMSGIGAGSYIALVEAVDQASNSTVIEESFNATVDTNLPAISILYPSTNAILTVNNPLTVSGTASDNNGLAWVSSSMIPLTNADRTVPNHGISFGAFAIGTSNWSLNFGIVPPGVYSNYAVVLDDVGNYNESAQLLTNTAILIKGNGSVTLKENGVIKPNAVGYPLQYGAVYSVEATPGAGQAFVAWCAGAYLTTNRVATFTMSPGLLWTATFVPTNGGKAISFTYPAANARLATNTFLLKGRMTSIFKSARISCQISSLTTGFGVGPLLAANGTTTWSAGVSNLPPDYYLVEAVATNAAGLSTIISEKFAIFPFSEVSGVYSGLFICTNSPVAPTNSGLLTFTLEPSGIFSGKLVFPAYAPIPIYPLLFANEDFTTGFFSTNVANIHGQSLNMAIYLGLNSGTNVAVGTISSDAWSSQLTCYRAVTKLSTNTVPATGKYILSLEPGIQTNWPYTNGYASLVIAKNGVMTLGGVLPDNTAFSQSVRVSKDGVWPLCAIPAGDKNEGMIIGWETNNAAGGCSGQLYWYKAPNIGAYYTGGVGVVSNMPLTSTGTNYSPPVAGSEYLIILEGGTIVTPLTNALIVNNAGQFVATGSPGNKLNISLSANGVITGSIFNINDNKTVRFKGAFISPSQGGAGFIPDAGGQTGCFRLEPQ